MPEILKKSWKIFVLLLLVAAVTVLFFGIHPSDSRQANEFLEPGKTGRPMVLDLGSTGCVPCQMMVPVLRELTDAYRGRVDVQFVEVSERGDLADRFGIYAIPTQIIFDRRGKEVFRHQGFLPKTEIDKKLKELGLI